MWGDLDLIFQGCVLFIFDHAISRQSNIEARVMQPGNIHIILSPVMGMCEKMGDLDLLFKVTDVKFCHYVFDKFLLEVAFSDQSTTS